MQSEKCDDVVSKDCWISFEDKVDVVDVEECEDVYGRECDDSAERDDGKDVCQTVTQTGIHCTNRVLSNSIEKKNFIFSVCMNTVKRFETTEDIVTCRTEKAEVCQDTEDGEKWCVQVRAQYYLIIFLSMYSIV